MTFETSGAAAAPLTSAIPNVNNIIGTSTAAYATFNENWARQSGNNTIVPFTGYVANTYTPGTHTDVTADFAFAGPATTSTLHFNNSSVPLDLGLDTQTLVLEQGGVLVTNDALTTTISNGTLTGAGAVGSEVIVHQNSPSPMTISAVIADNGTNATTLTKAGVGGSTLILTGANTYTGGTHVNQGTLQIGVGGTVGSLGQGVVLNDATLLFNRSDDVTVLNPIGGYGTVIKSGAGILNLRGTNNFGGGLVVSQGTVATDGPQSLGLGAVTLGDSGTGSTNVALLSDIGADISNNIVVAAAGTGTASIGSSSSGVGVADPAIFTGTIMLNRNTIFQASNSDRTTYTGVIAGAANLSFTAGRSTLENNNTFVGNVSVETGATLQVGTGSFANIRNQIPDASTVTLNGSGAFRLNGDSEVIAQLNSASNTSTLQTIAGGPTVLTLTNGGAFAGAFDGGVNGGLTIENTGGTLTLSGTADNPTGRVLVNGGTVILAKTSNSGVHAVAVDVTVNAGLLQLGGTGGDQVWDGSATNRTQMVINGGVFDLNGVSEGFSVLNGLGGIVRNDVAATTSTLTLGTNNWSNQGYFGSIQNGAGTVALTKTGAGGLILTGSNTYTGPTTISAGILQLGNGAAGGSLGSGAVSNSGTLVFNRSDAFTFSNIVDGTGRLVQNGSGATTLNGANVYTGSTTVNAGTLLVTGSISASAVTVNGGGTLGGTGTTGAVSVGNGGTLAPGTTIGTLSTGPFSLFNGSIFSLEIGATTADQTNVTGGTLLDGNDHTRHRTDRRPGGQHCVHRHQFLDRRDRICWRRALRLRRQQPRPRRAVRGQQRCLQPDLRHRLQCRFRKGRRAHRRPRSQCPDVPGSGAQHAPWVAPIPPSRHVTTCSRGYSSGGAPCLYRLAKKYPEAPSA